MEEKDDRDCLIERNLKEFKSSYFFKKSSVTLAEMSSSGLPRPNTSPSLKESNGLRVGVRGFRVLAMRLGRYGRMVRMREGAEMIEGKLKED